MGAGHRFFLGVLGLGAVLRVITMLGYRPALWFPDSYTYVVTALRPRPDLVRPAGYSMFLRLLEPFHSFALVALVQHLLGLMVGVLVYLTARRLRAPGWAAAGASVLPAGRLPDRTGAPAGLRHPVRRSGHVGGLPGRAAGRRVAYGVRDRAAARGGDPDQDRRAADGRALRGLDALPGAGPGVHGQGADARRGDAGRGDAADPADTGPGSTRPTSGSASWAPTASSSTPRR